jgi:tripartite-type tricarboxylate transporter receptor subunit TctC
VGSAQKRGRCGASILALSLVVATASCASSGGDDGDDQAASEATYAGEEITLIVGSSPGGGFDTYGQLIARHLGDFLPGEPGVSVIHQPGAGGMIAYNNTWARESKDGTVVTLSIGSALMNSFFDVEEALYESEKFVFVGAPVAEQQACVVRGDLGIDELGDQDPAGEPLVFAGIGPGVLTDIMVRAIATVTDFNVELRTGYPGTSEMRLAMLQGEVDGLCFGTESIQATLQEELESGDVKVIVQFGDERTTAFPDVPILQEYIDEKDEESLALLDATVNIPQMMDRPLVVHPDVPKARVESLRQAFSEMVEDEAFLEDAAQAKVRIIPVTGESLQGEMERLVEAVTAAGDGARTVFLG